MIQMTITIGQRPEGLELAQKRLQDLRPLLKVIGSIARTSIVRNFEVGGRPQTWKPSLRVVKKGGKTLILSSALMSSIAVREPQITDTTVTVGSNRVYAAIQNLGGVIETGPRHQTLAFRQGKDGKLKGFASRAEASRSKKKSTPIRIAMSGGAYIPIPARQFMLLQTEDFAEIQQVVSDFVTGGAQWRQ